VKDIQESLAVHPSSLATAMAESDANPDLDASFKGIERYLGTSAWKEAAVQGAKLTQALGGSGPYSILPANLSKAKKLVQAVVLNRSNRDDTQWLLQALRAMEAQVAARVAPPNPASPPPPTSRG
jgi:hypothetical protein